MTNTDGRAEFDLCPDAGGSGIQVLDPRLVPLGGPRAMTVRRTLPHRDRSFVGAWCFVDHYGPDRVADTGGMDVPPHPHTGLQTVSWLFAGEVEHRDSAGVHATIRPGEVNLMTGGGGIAHSEVSLPDVRTLHGVQLWVVLPAAVRDAPRDFQHATPPSVEVADGVTARLFVGELAGEKSPIETFTPLLGAEIEMAADAHWEVPVRADFEHAVLVDSGRVTLCNTNLSDGQLGISETGPTTLGLRAKARARLVLLGGTPFDEEVVMWWNFIASSHDGIVKMREEWQSRSSRFGEVTGYTGDTTHLPAPEMPQVQLRPRGRFGKR